MKNVKIKENKLKSISLGYFKKKNEKTSGLSDVTIEDRNTFFKMLLKIQLKHPHFNAKKVMKKLYPDYFSL